MRVYTCALGFPRQLTFRVRLSILVEDGSCDTVYAIPCVTDRVFHHTQPQKLHSFVLDFSIVYVRLGKLNFIANLKTSPSIIPNKVTNPIYLLWHVPI